MTSETETIVASPLEADFVASTYTDAQRRATQKYRTENKEKVNEQRKKYYQARKESDPHFLEYINNLFHYHQLYLDILGDRW